MTREIKLEMRQPMVHSLRSATHLALPEGALVAPRSYKVIWMDTVFLKGTAKQNTIFTTEPYTSPYESPDLEPFSAGISRLKFVNQDKGQQRLASLAFVEERIRYICRGGRRESGDVIRRF